ncbi:uncharacterized protein LOC135215646 [Macrobrachium nipponense]|uniref:uncharacterized protein LOC135215646 n=1 Tax=Macrobrachium nipponense TaxID=159736 RepID=UPI0030C7CE54
MKAQQFYAFVAFVCVGSSVMAQEETTEPENNLTALLQNLNLTDSQTQRDFLDFVDPKNLPTTITCLIEGGGPDCDPRTAAVRTVLQELSASDYQCSSCDADTQRVLNVLLRGIRQTANPLQCKSLEEGLQLAAHFCS